MKYKLFLDDVRQPHDVRWVKLPEGHWLIARTYGEFVDTIEQLGLPEFVSFDHDLTEYHYKASLLENEHLSGFTGYGPEKTGLDAAAWLRSYCVRNNLSLPPFEVHSLNSAGESRIREVLR